MAVQEQQGTGAAGALPEHVRVAIVGSGFAGLGMAIRLSSGAITDFVVSSAATTSAAPGATTPTPAAACDVPSSLYSFSFAPNPDVDAVVLAAAARSWPTCAAAPTASAIRPHLRFGLPTLRGGGWDEAARRWRLDTTAGALTARRARLRRGRAERADLPDIPGVDDVRGQDVPLGRLGPHARPDRRARRGHRHRRLGDPDRPGDPARRRAARRLPAHAGVDRPAHRPRRSPAVERRLYRALPALQRLVRAAIYWGREGSCSASPAAAAHAAPRSDRPAPPAPGRSATRSCGASSRRTTRSAASGS